MVSGVLQLTSVCKEKIFIEYGEKTLSLQKIKS
jgi:hypothetical protein